MEQLQVFKNELFEVGAKVEGDTILFDAEQVAKCLGITEVKGNKEYVMWRRVNKYLFGTSAENSTIVNKGSLLAEPMVYKLAFKANNEVAEKFQDWLAVEVIPSIRKNGGYIATNDDDDESTIMAKALLIAKKTIERKQRENEALHRQIEQDAPYTKFGKVVAISDGAINIGVFAKMLYDKHGINMGRNKLMAWMRDKGFLIRQKGVEWNLPKQEYIEKGWFKIRPAIVSRTEGDIQKGTPLITGKGQVAITNILLEEFSNKAV